MFEFLITQGASIPQDAGYAMLAGLSRQFPFLHGREDIQVAPIIGTLRRNKVVVTHRGSRLHIRGITAEEAATIAGGWFQIEGQVIGIGAYTEITHALPPIAALVSRRVIFEGATTREDFAMALVKTIPVGTPFQILRRGTLSMKGKHFIGYGVRLSSLVPEDCKTVLTQGLGKFTSMGCGVFAESTR